jgi:hypothetical protein
MKLDLRHDPARGRPAGRLVLKALVPDHRGVTRASDRPPEQLGDLALQDVVRWDADRVPHAPLLQGFVELRSTHDHVLALALLPLDLRQEHFLPLLGAVDAARPQLRRQTVASRLNSMSCRYMTSFHGLVERVRVHADEWVAVR